MKTYITYKDIVKMGPCYDPKDIGMSEDYSKPILECIKEFRDKVKSKDDIIWILCREDYMSKKDMRLFAVWCAREALKLIDNPDPRSINACNIAEAFALDKATKEELNATWDAAWDAASDAASDAMNAARYAAWAAAWAAKAAASDAMDAAMDAAWDAARTAAWAAMAAASDARYAAWDAAWDAASDASDAMDAAMDAALDAARTAAWAAMAAASDAAGDASRDAQIDQLLTYFK